MPGRLLTGNAAEDGADRHPDAGEIALEEDVPRHDFPGSVDVLSRLTVRHQHARERIDLETEICERDPRPERIRPERRSVEPLRPVCFVRTESLGTAIVERARVERARAHCAVENLDR